MELKTSFHQRSRRAAEIAVYLTVVATFSVASIYLSARILAFLQPILVPFAVAGVLAYLLEPGVQCLERKGLTRRRAVVSIFSFFFAIISLLGCWIVPQLASETVNLAEKSTSYALQAQQKIYTWVDRIERNYKIELLPKTSRIERWRGKMKDISKAASGDAREKVTQWLETIRNHTTTTSLPSTGPERELETSAGLQEKPRGSVAEQVADRDRKGAIVPSKPEVKGIEQAPEMRHFDYDLTAFLSGDWVRAAVPFIWKVVRQSFGGFLGIFGILFSLVIVPLYLYYFLIEGRRIKETWSDYLPLKASAFKAEVVDCLTEINGYLIAFFRGQLLVSAINGATTGLLLEIAGLEFAFLIGLMLCVLGIIPYLGIALCWIPAMVIATAQDGSYFIPSDPWWAMPMVVTLIFVAVQQVDGFFISPKIVGGSVGLHPMTVIVSVFAWSLLLGGILGAVLAVPLTASLKVLFQRYIWAKRMAPYTVGGARYSMVKSDSAIQRESETTTADRQDLETG